MAADVSGQRVCSDVYELPLPAPLAAVRQLQQQVFIALGVPRAVLAPSVSAAPVERLPRHEQKRRTIRRLDPSDMTS